MKRIIGAGLIALSLAACGVPVTNKPLGSTETSSSSTTEETSQTPTYHVPVKKDFTLKVKVLSKSCFGTAGCNLTFRVTLAYNKAAGPLDPSKTYDVTYVLKGTEDPKSDTIEVTGDQYAQPSDDFTSTKSSATKVTALVTEVSEQ